MQCIMLTDNMLSILMNHVEETKRAKHKEGGLSGPPFFMSWTVPVLDRPAGERLDSCQCFQAEKSVILKLGVVSP
jgi:hypothetical protein